MKPALLKLDVMLNLSYSGLVIKKICPSIYKEKIMPWVLDPHSGGTKIPPSMHETLKRKIMDHANKKYSGKFESINVRFRIRTGLRFENY